ncbi:uncharacterized protein LOC122153260 [Tyto alba]|uniref:uncharacterized protein LOC122153260 n=1 Tax=Tyto alba TaxID=56313 RepID=UPI001C67837F|nr:uncharacterized protein LOC122153260 [Tyto alba]XP_042646423.1 uncharacterized protein LOC122153260 [Tyto alba]XP_042646424.1 uncharacterized protein LOC122153260 [Tyto alba]
MDREGMPARCQCRHRCVPSPWAQAAARCRQTCPCSPLPSPTKQCRTSLLEHGSPLARGAHGAGAHCPAGPAVGQRLCKGVGWEEGPCGTSPGSGSLWLFPHLAGAQGWPGRGWYGDNPTPAKAAPKPRSRLMDAANLGHHRALLFPTKTWGQRRGEPSTLHRAVSAPVPSWVHPAGGAGAGCRGSRRRCTICFSSGGWERRSCRGPAAERGCDRWSVYHVSALLRMLVFACERHFWAWLLPPSSFSSCSPHPAQEPRLFGGGGVAEAHLDPRVKAWAAALLQPPVLAHGKGWAQPCCLGNGSGQCLDLGSRGAGQLQALLCWGLGRGQGWGGTAGAFAHSSSPGLGKGQRAGRGALRDSHGPKPSWGVLALLSGSPGPLGAPITLILSPSSSPALGGSTQIQRQTPPAVTLSLSVPAELRPG